MRSKLIFSISILLMIVSSDLFSQEKSRPATWKTYYENAQVRIEFHYEECKLPSEGTHKEMVYLKVINKTSDIVQVSWEKNLWYGDKCYGCEGDNSEFYVTMLLKPSESREGNCDKMCPNELKIFSKMLNHENLRVLNGFELKDVKVITVKTN